MPAPLAAVVGSAAVGSATSSLISPAIGGMMNGLLAPEFRALTYMANRPAGGLVPELKDLMATYFAGKYSLNWFQYLASMYGVDNPRSNQDRRENWETIWRPLIETYRPRPSLDHMITGYHLGHISDDDMQARLRIEGLADLGDRTQALSRYTPFAPSTLLALWQRDYISSETYESHMHASGYWRSSELNGFARLRFAIPGPSDLIRFAVREVWNDEVVRNYDYDLEFPETFAYWMRKQGMDYDFNAADFGDAPQRNVRWPLAYWRAHWNTLSPTMCIQAYNRFRGDAANQASWRQEGVRPFTRQDFDYMLKIADYPPIIRNWIIGLAKRPLTRVDVRRARKLGVISRDEVYQQHLDIGYTERDAEILTEYTERDIRKSAESRDKARTATALRNAMAVGLLSDDEASDRFYYLYTDKPEEIEEYRNASRDRKNEILDSRPDVLAILSTVRLADTTAWAKRVTKHIERLYVKGNVDRESAIQALTNIGITERKAQGYLAIWELFKVTTQRELSASQVLRYLTKGILPAVEAERRLKAIGFADADIAVMMENAKLDLRLAIERLKEKQARTIKQRRAAQRRQLREQSANRNRIIADLNRSATKAQIGKFFMEGLINEAEAISALKDRGVMEDDIKRTIQVWINKMRRS